MNADGNINAIDRHLDDCEEHDAWQDLQDQLEAALADAKEAEAYAEELEQELRDTQDRANAFATKEYYTEMRAERAEAKLAKAVEALEGVKDYVDDASRGRLLYRGKTEISEMAGEDLIFIQTTLAEIKGETK